jgi:hypothetical protein
MPGRKTTQQKARDYARRMRLRCPSRDACEPFLAADWPDRRPRYNPRTGRALTPRSRTEQKLRSDCAQDPRMMVMHGPCSSMSSACKYWFEQGINPYSARRIAANGPTAALVNELCSSHRQGSLGSQLRAARGRLRPVPHKKTPPRKTSLLEMIDAQNHGTRFIYEMTKPGIVDLQNGWWMTLFDIPGDFNGSILSVAGELRARPERPIDFAEGQGRLMQSLGEGVAGTVFSAQIPAVSRQEDVVLKVSASSVGQMIAVDKYELLPSQVYVAVREIEIMSRIECGARGIIVCVSGLIGLRINTMIYAGVVMERMDMNVDEFVKGTVAQMPPEERYLWFLGIMMKMLLQLRRLHTIGYLHMDPHLGNWMVKSPQHWYNVDLRLLDFEKACLISDAAGDYSCAAQRSVSGNSRFARCLEYKQSYEYMLFASNIKEILHALRMRETPLVGKTLDLLFKVSRKAEYDLSGWIDPQKPSAVWTEYLESREAKGWRGLFADLQNTIDIEVLNNSMPEIVAHRAKLIKKQLVSPENARRFA